MRGLVLESDAEIIATALERLLASHPPADAPNRSDPS